MKRRPRPSLLIPGLLAGLAIVAAGCGTTAAPPTGSVPPASATGSTPAVETPAPVAITTPAVIADQAPLDGKPIAVTGFFTTDGARHLVCDAVLESYPPQCGGSVIVVNGTVPPPVLAALDRAKDQPLSKIAWGNVEIRGVFHAAPAGQRPSLDLTEMRVVGP
jgi:hypothetical protein